MAAMSIETGGGGDPDGASHDALAAVAPSVASDTGATFDRRIEGDGTPPSAWQADPALQALPTLTFGDLLPVDRRLVVVAPHPDDEVLGCGGLLSMAIRRQAAVGRDADDSGVLLVAVTDGDASHPGSARWTPGALVEQRSCERVRGLAALGSAVGAGVELRVLRMRDGHLANDEPALMHRLGGLLRPTDVLVTTWRLDGHPDHEACGRVCAALSVATGCSLWEMPVWMWHWAVPGDPRVPWRSLRRLSLEASAAKRKRTAIQCHRSQLEPDGHRPAVLPPAALDRLLRPSEYFFQGAVP